ncbi:MAG TPA: single-stranded DNA-binding protein [Acidimicrobiia bacterium]|jgi:single-strand DNA-binding protein|nr:single-stranded DNA-binding protein [Acidimicrobiia bacterium]
MSGNSITIVGNITRDPELRFTPSGQANARLGVAVNRRWQDKSSGEWQEATSFFDVICWRELAENVSESLKRGARVIVTGRLEQRTWEQEGNKRSVVEIIADEVAPSLRWATAKVEKTERRSGGDQGGGGGGSGFGRSAPPAETSGGSGGGGGYDDFGDEPF